MVAKLMTPEQCFAKATAYEEAAEHLDQPWTDDPTEWEFGQQIARALGKQAELWRRIGNDRKPSNARVDRPDAALSRQVRSDDGLCGCAQEGDE